VAVQKNMWGTAPECPRGYGSGAHRAEVPFHNSAIDNFMVCEDRLETNLLQLFVHPENNVWGQCCCWTETYGNGHLVFYNFQCPQLFHFSHALTAVPASLKVVQYGSSLVILPRTVAKKSSIGGLYVRAGGAWH